METQVSKKYSLGFIGLGSMGNMLINSFIASGEVSPSDIITATRTKSKLDAIKSVWGDINLTQSNAEAVQYSRYIFICVKPKDVRTVLEEIKGSVTNETHIISIAGPVKISNIEAITNGQVSKLTPTLASEVAEGVSLLCHGRRVTRENASFIEALLKNISVVKLLEENEFEVIAEITSCGPGLFSAMFKELVHSAVRHTNGISREAIEEVLLRTLLGTIKLYFERNMSLNEIVERVATKGGITEEGISVLQQELPQTLDNMFLKMLDKRKKIEALVNSEYF